MKPLKLAIAGRDFVVEILKTINRVQVYFFAFEWKSVYFANGAILLFKICEYLMINASRKEIDAF